MPRPINIQPGQTFERLTVIFQTESKKGHRMFECKCACGKTVTVRGSALVSGNTSSCGCWNIEAKLITAKARTKLFVYDENGKINPEYSTYRHMKARCYNENNKKYKDYGARGIVVCDRWLESYANFINDVGKRPTESHTLDRIDVNGNYEPGNCQWALPVVQSNNQRRNIFMHLNDFLVSQAQLAKILGINPKSVEFQRKRGLSAQQIINKYKKPDYVIKFIVVDKKIFAKD